MKKTKRRTALGLMLGGISLAGLSGRAFANAEQGNEQAGKVQETLINWIEETFQNGRLFESQGVSRGKVSTHHQIYLNFEHKGQLLNQGVLNLSMASFPKEHGLEDFHDCERNYALWKQEKFELAKYRLSHIFYLFTTQPDGELRWLSGGIRQNFWDERRNRYHRQRNLCQGLVERRNLRLGYL